MSAGPGAKNSGSLAYRGSVAYIIDLHARRSPRQRRRKKRKEGPGRKEQVAVLKKQNLNQGVRKKPSCTRTQNSSAAVLQDVFISLSLSHGNQWALHFFGPVELCLVLFRPSSTAHGISGQESNQNLIICSKVHFLMIMTHSCLYNANCIRIQWWDGYTFWIEEWHEKRSKPYRTL